MADVVSPPMESAPVGPITKTAVTVTAGGAAMAVVDLISSAVAAYGGELTPTTHDALLLLIMGVFGWVIHSQVLREDRAAFHQWVLTRFGYHPGGIVPVAAPPPPQPPGGTVAPILPRQWPQRPQPSPMGDVRP
jgi:hypothetical protein